MNNKICISVENFQQIAYIIGSYNKPNDLVVFEEIDTNLCPIIVSIQRDNCKLIEITIPNSNASVETNRKKDITHLKRNYLFQFIKSFFMYEFLFEKSYENFATKIQEKFILSKEQWEWVLNEWELKESGLD